MLSVYPSLTKHRAPKVKEPALPVKRDKRSSSRVCTEVRSRKEHIGRTRSSSSRVTATITRDPSAWNETRSSDPCDAGTVEVCLLPEAGQGQAEEMLMASDVAGNDWVG